MFVWFEKIQTFLLLLLFVQLIFNVEVGESQFDKQPGGNRKPSGDWWKLSSGNKKSGPSSSSDQSNKHQQPFKEYKLFGEPSVLERNSPFRSSQSSSGKAPQSSAFKDRSTSSLSSAQSNKHQQSFKEYKLFGEPSVLERNSPFRSSQSSSGKAPQSSAFKDRSTSSSSSAQSNKHQQSFNEYKLFGGSSMFGSNLASKSSQSSWKTSPSSASKDLPMQRNTKSKLVQLAPESKDYSQVLKGGKDSKVVPAILKQKGSSKYH